MFSKNFEYSLNYMMANIKVNYFTIQITQNKDGIMLSFTLLIVPYTCNRLVWLCHIF